MSQEFRNKMCELENITEQPSFISVNSKIMDIGSKLLILEQVSIDNKELVADIQKDLKELMLFVKEQGDKQEQLKQLAFMLANKI